MASNHGGKDVMDCGSSEGNISETTVEIKIKTLDSQTYTLRVDKCVPVPALKEQIATVTGVLSDQQRLICRGKVLKDDQLLSAYHVEDGHTLHLVARQPIDPSLASFLDHTASDPTSNTGHTTDNESGHRVVVGTFDISGQGDGGIPDISRIVSAVLGSFGVANAGNGGEAVDLQEHISERLSRIPGLGDLRNFTTQQPENASGRGQATSLPADVSVETLQAPVIPDSLTTLSQYLRRLRQEFNSNARSWGNNSQILGSPESAGQDSNATPHSAVRQGGLPTPAALAEVTESTRQLLINQTGECLTQLTGQLGNQVNVTDSVARTRMQSNALRSGALLQNLGSFLLELGRTTMTLRMGQTPTDAVVNAGPAVFISTSGPNPIMVQPLPFQPGTSFGTPVGSGASFSVGSGSRPRNIDIRIRTGSLLSSAVNPRETSAEERSARTDPAVSDQAAPRNLPSTRESDVRVVPIRISTISPVIAHSDSSRSSMGILYPALARDQHVDSGGIRGQAADGSRPHNGDSRPQPATQQQHSEVLGASGTTQTDGGRTFTAEIHSGVDQLLSNLFTRDQNAASDFVFQGMGTNPVSLQGMSTNPISADVQQDSQSVSADGMFLSNLLHQIMPIVSRNLNGANGSSGHGVDVGDGGTQPSSSVENQDRGASSRQSDDHASPPTSKRQKRE